MSSKKYNSDSLRNKRENEMMKQKLIKSRGGSLGGITEASLTEKHVYGEDSQKAINKSLEYPSEIEQVIPINEIFIETYSGSMTLDDLKEDK